MTPFIAAQQLANATHVSVLCTQYVAESPSAGGSAATALGYTFFPDQKGTCTLHVARVSTYS